MLAELHHRIPFIILLPFLLGCSYLCLLADASAPPTFGPDQFSDSCTIYLAPSSIPGAGLGIYTAKSFKEDDFVTSGDIAIPLLDLQAHNPHYQINDLIIQSYYWMSYEFPSMAEESAQQLAFCPGAGAAINCYFPLLNIQAADSETDWSNAGLHRSKDPGVGAFTAFHNRTTYATRDIQAGEELFTDYGPGYFTSQEELFGKIPLWDTLNQTDDLLKKFVKTLETITAATNAGNKADSDKEQSANMPHTTVQTLHEDWFQLLTEMKNIWPSRILNGLPHTADTVEELAKTSVIWRDYNRSVKSIEWLEKEGHCMDNIYPEQSLIPQAGRGAFAKRKIPKGGLVGPAPLVHLDRTVLYIYPGYDSETFFQADMTRPVIHDQLLLNYCFGHSESNLVLCPYGMLTSLINHSRKAANAKVVWNERIMNHKEWLNMPLREWIEEEHNGLAIDFVATRAIKPGEEIYIDYGDDWQDAWDKHVKNWKPPQHAHLYRPAREFNNDVNLTVQTISEGLYHSVNVLCHEFYLDLQGLDFIVSEDDDDVNADLDAEYCQATQRYTSPKSGETRYMAEIYDRVDSGDVCMEMLIGVLFDVPRAAFLFEDRSYSRDTHQTWSFRQPMGIPEEMMPDIWKNLKK